MSAHQVITSWTPGKRRTLSESARASAAAYRRRLRFEIDVMGAQRRAGARGCAVRGTSLAGYPAALELVRGLAARVAAGARIPPSGVMVYRGERVLVRQTSFGRLLVETLDGRPIGASGFGSAWTD